MTVTTTVVVPLQEAVKSLRYLNNSERPVDALAVKKVNHSVTDNLKSRDASASKNLSIIHIWIWNGCNQNNKSPIVRMKKMHTTLLISGTMCTPTLLVMLLVFDIASQSMPAQDGRLPSHHNAPHHHHPTLLSFAWQLSSQIFASSWNQDPSKAPADSERCQRGLHSVSLQSPALTLFDIMLM